MSANDDVKADRRQFLQAAATAAACLVLGSVPLATRAAAKGGGMKIGVIGSGRIGGTLGSLWVKAGHEVLFSARNLDEVRRVIEGLGPKARAGTPQEAAAFGDVILVSVPAANREGSGG